VQGFAGEDDGVAAVVVVELGEQAADVGRIAMPTLLIWGELDARSPLGVARQFEQAIRRRRSSCSPAPAI
jgi:pimeloyl-ACP methyl ester carboxylesterase